MPIEIAELEIKAHIADPNGSRSSSQDNPLDAEEIIQQAVERILDILRRKAEL